MVVENIIRLVAPTPPAALQSHAGFDACLVSDQGRFECHRVMLAAVSPVLRTLLQEVPDDDVTIIHFPDYPNSEIFFLSRLIRGKPLEETDLRSVPSLFQELGIDLLPTTQSVDQENGCRNVRYDSTIEPRFEKELTSEEPTTITEEEVPIKVETESSIGVDDIDRGRDTSASDTGVETFDCDNHELDQDYDHHENDQFINLASFSADVVSSHENLIEQQSPSDSIRNRSIRRESKRTKQRTPDYGFLDVSDQYENEYNDHLSSSLKGSNSDIPKQIFSDNNQFGNRPSHVSFKENKSPRNYRENVKVLRKKASICHICQQPVTTFRKHFKRVHAAEERRQSGSLLEEYRSFLAYNQMENRCRICNKTFQSKKNLRIHTKIKHTEYAGTYSCPACNRDFQQLITLKKHVFNFHADHALDFTLTHQGNTDVIEPKRTSNSSDENKGYICDLCAKVFNSGEDLKIHMWIHAKSIKCRIENCFEEFPRKAAFVDHMLRRHKVVVKVNRPRNNSMKVGSDIGDKSHLCSDCGESFKSKKNLNSHIKGVHSKQFSCHICNKVCKRKVALDLHVAKHGPPTIQCEMCDKAFYSNYNMRRHMITMHVDNAQKPYKCTLCPKGFESAKNLEGHLNMHNGLKPYICEVCGKGFQNASNRRAHIKKIHCALP